MTSTQSTPATWSVCLKEAGVNWLWITWSVGYSLAEEQEQRRHAKNMLARLHANGIKVAAYMRATSIFWESMFRDNPRSGRSLSFDPNGVLYCYSGGREPARFMGDISNPE